MKYIDMHCDTILTVPDDGSSDLLINNPKASVDFDRLRQSDAMAQFYAIFLMNEEMFKEEGKKCIPDDEYILRSVNMLKEAVKNTNYMEMAYNYNDLMNNSSNDKISALLTIEDGRSATSIEKIKRYHDLGIRLITLTWNFENSIGYPNSDDKTIMQKGLKNYGFKAVEYMNEIGMLVDVSHLSDGGFYDVASTAKKPFVASHSNSRALSPHNRNLTDEMIKIIAEKGGAIGLNFAPEFLAKDITNTHSKIELMINHLNYIKNIGGEDVIALGSDFDGIEGNLEISGSHEMPKLFDALKNNGWSETQLEKLTHQNMLRVIKETLK